DFEGVIPEGEYGAGTVILWDRGTYRSLNEEPVAEQVAGGHVAVWLEGKKLRGGYALTRLGGGGRERWLLVKMDDEHADRRRQPRRARRAARRLLRAGPAPLRGQGRKRLRRADAARAAPPARAASAAAAAVRHRRPAPDGRALGASRARRPDPLRRADARPQA